MNRNVDLSDSVEFSVQQRLKDIAGNLTFRVNNRVNNKFQYWNNVLLNFN